MPFNRGVEVRSLAQAAGGEQLQVVDILFDTVRQLCPSLGLHPGEVVDCEGRTSRDIILRRNDGARIVVDRFYASFVAIRTLGLRPVSSPDIQKHRAAGM